jgi:hypothetical protein
MRRHVLPEAAYPAYPSGRKIGNSQEIVATNSSGSFTVESRCHLPGKMSFEL